MKNQPSTRAIRGLLPVLFVAALPACNALGITGEDENEVRVTIEALGADFLDADDGFTYEVNADTEYERIDDFASLAVGEIVQIEYADLSSGRRRALEIEADGPEDDD